jgi:hypothetical protein
MRTASPAVEMKLAAKGAQRTLSFARQINCLRLAYLAGKDGFGERNGREVRLTMLTEACREPPSQRRAARR